MVTRRREGGRGSRLKNVRKKCWQVPSRLMGERNGYVHSVLNPMCGRGGIAGDATTTTQQFCGENTGSRLRRELARSPRALRRRVERRPRAETSWTSREKGCSGNCVRSKDSSICRRKRLKGASKRICNSSYRKLSRGGMIFCRSTRGCRRGLRRYRVSRTRRKHTKRDSGCSGGDAEDQRGNQSKRGALSSAVGQGRLESDGRSGNGSETSRIAGRRRKKRQQCVANS